MGDLLVSQLNEDLDKDKIAMTHVYVVSTGGQMSLDENQQFIDQLAALPGVNIVEGQAVYPMDWRSPSSNKFEQGTVIAFSEGFEDVQLEPISRVVEGRYPEGGQNEVAVEQRFVDEHGVEIGDTIVFRGATDVEWEIVGVVFQPYATISPYATDVTTPITPPEASIYATYDDAQSIVGFPGLSSFSARYDSVKEAEDGLNDFVELISSQTPYITAFSFIDDPEQNALVEGTQQITSVLNLLAIVSMIVSAFLVVNVINTIIFEQKQQIGILKSIGASRLDNFYIYTGMAFIYGVIGAIIGVILATPVASLFAQEIAPLSGTYIEDFRISTLGTLTGLFLGLLVPVIAALIPVYNGTRVTILQAITNLGISSNWGNTRLSRMIGGAPLPVTVRQALSNILQKKARLALTGLTLTLAFGAFMGVTALFSSLDEAIEDIFDTFDYEVQMTTQEAQDFEAVRQLLFDNIDNVSRVVPGYGVSVSLEGYEAPANSFSAGDQVQAFGVDPSAGVVNWRLTSGTGWNEDTERNGIILNRTVAENVNKKAGDTVTVSVGGQAHEYEVIGVDQWPFDAVFFRWQELASIAGYTNAEGQPNPGAFFIDLNGEPDADSVANTIEELKQLTADNNIQAVFANQPQNEEDISQFVATFGLMFNMTSVVMATVGAIGLLATLSMSVFERQKEIGVMRSLGAGSMTIVVQFLIEGVLVGVIAWVFALPISLFLGNALNSALELEDFFTFEYPLLVAIQGLVGVIIISAIASIWPSISAARRTVSEILRYQ
jgi:putative ABC transport system permease protein